jgi:hypothetical protein
MTTRPPEIGVKIRRIVPKRNACCLDGLTATVKLFGERYFAARGDGLGKPRERERTETFPDDASLYRRRTELLE